MAAWTLEELPTHLSKAARPKAAATDGRMQLGSHLEAVGV